MCETSMMPLRVAMPNSVMNPIIEATLSTPPARNTPADAADQRERQVHHDQQRVARAAEREHEQHEQPGDRRRRRAAAAAATRSARSRTARRTRRDSPPASARPAPPPPGCRRRRCRDRGRRRCTRSTIRRCTFSRRIMFGPSSRRTSASSRIGTATAVRRVDRQIGHAIEVRLRGRIELHDQIERRPAIEDAARRSRPRSSSRSPPPRRRPAARTARWPSDSGRTGRTARPSAARATGRRRPALAAIDVAHVFAESPQRRQIVAEHLHGDVGARARQHVIDAVRDRLPDRHVGAGQRREPAPQLRQQLRARAAPSPAGRRRSPPPRRPARARRTRPGRSGAPSPRLPAAPAGSARRDGQSHRTWRATYRAACWPAPSGCLRGTPAETPCPCASCATRRATRSSTTDAAITRRG